MQMGKPVSDFEELLVRGGIGDSGQLRAPSFYARKSVGFAAQVPTRLDARRGFMN